MSFVMEKAAQLFEPLFSCFGSWTVSYSVKTVICRAVKGAPWPTRIDASIPNSYPVFHVNVRLELWYELWKSEWRYCVGLRVFCLFLLGVSGVVSEEVRLTQWRKAWHDTENSAMYSTQCISVNVQCTSNTIQPESRIKKVETQQKKKKKKKNLLQMTKSRGVLCPEEETSRWSHREKQKFVWQMSYMSYSSASCASHY